MRAEELDELHYITPVENIPSILRRGIVSHRKAAALSHLSVADSDIQDRRVGRRVPNGLPLHDYVNLYIHARNPMLFKRLSQHRDLCVLRISTSVLDLPGVVVTDGNAASDYTTRFGSGRAGLVHVDKELTFAERWTDSDLRVQYEKKRRKCAEVLVPHRVPPDYIKGARVSCPEGRQNLRSTGAEIAVRIDIGLFFDQSQT